MSDQNNFESTNNEVVNSEPVYNEPANSESVYSEQMNNGPVYSEQMNQNAYNNYQQTSNPQEEKVRAQVEKERVKFEKKRAKTAKKLQKKAEKKAKVKENGHGPVFKAATVGVGAVAFGLIATGTMYFAGDQLGIYSNDSNKSTPTISRTSTNTNTNSIATTTGASLGSTNTGSVTVTDVSDVVDEVMPSVVAITSTQLVQSGYGDLFDYYFGYGNNSDNSGYEEQTGAGSGIIIGQNDTELLVVTNNHVIEGADSLKIQFIDDESVDAYVKGTSASNDLAVVAVKLSDIKESTLNEIKVATLGDSDALEVGEGTIAIGNALGYGQSVTTGVISALNREVEYEDSETKTLIQTDAAINPGNSGGALLNSKGEVIGINAAKYSSSSIEGMGFAIPVSSVKDVIEDLMNRETREKVSDEEKGYLNIYGRDVTDELSQMYNAPTGVLVVNVIEKGAAEKAGIEKSDIITKVNGQEISSMEELSSELEYYKKGEKVTLTVQYLKDKSYVEKEVEVTLGGELE